MAVYPDGYTMLETFLDGIPADMRRYLIREDGLSPEVNDVEEFVAYAIRYEQSLKTANHYEHRSRHKGGPRRLPPGGTPSRGQHVGTFLAKKTDLDCDRNTRFVVRRTPAAN